MESLNIPAEEVTARAAGRRGGLRTAEVRGPSHYTEIGRKGGEVLLKRRGAQHFRELGRRSAEVRRLRLVIAASAN